MSPLRLVLVTRRFWPLVGGAEMTMANLASALADRGHAITLLTASWNPDWPAEILHRGVQVRRIAQSSRRIVGTWRYMRGLAKWLRQQRRAFDLAYVSMLKHDAYATLGVGHRAGFPVVLRAEGGGSTGDVAWQATARGGRCIARRCKRADALVAPSMEIQHELQAANYPFHRLHRIPNGVASSPERTPQRRQVAREALGTAHPVLSLGNDTSLAVYVGRLSPEKGLHHLIDAWSRVLRNRSNTRLWIVGEGPERDRLAAQIEQLKLRGRCVLVGSFDSVDELLAAADLFVLPSIEEGMSLALLEAMANGLPIVASDIPGNRALIESGSHGLLVLPNDPGTLAVAISNLLDNRRRATDYGSAARSRAQSQFALATMVERHEQLFRQVLNQEKFHSRGAETSQGQR